LLSLSLLHLPLLSVLLSLSSEFAVA